MSEKEFEEIYRKIKEEETPDLWDKIERKLEVKPQKKKYNKWIISCSTLAASVVIFLLIVPLISTQNQKQDNAGINNSSKVEDYADDIDNLSEGTQKEEKDSVDKENPLFDSTIKNEEEKSENTNGKFSIKESSNVEIDINLENINAKLQKEGIVLKEVDVEEIEELEVVETKNLPEELQIVVEVLEKVKKTYIYYKDLDDSYYVKLSKKVYKIFY